MTYKVAVINYDLMALGGEPEILPDTSRRRPSKQDRSRS